MPYYMRQTPIRHCDREGCDRVAVLTLYRPDNEPIGAYCKPHGEARLEQMNTGLAEEVAAGRWSR